MDRLLAAVVLGGLLVGCSTEATPGTADGDGTPTAVEATSDEPTALATDDPAVRDAVLLTAVDEVLADTRFADLVDEDPGAFLETADTLCAGLDDGVAVDEVLAVFLTTLGDEGLTLDEDTAYLGGAVLGAAVTVRCPEHEAAVAEVAP